LKVKKFFGAGGEEEEKEKPTGIMRFMMPDSMFRRVWV
jgi:hypothetical protein